MIWVLAAYSLTSLVFILYLFLRRGFLADLARLALIVSVIIHLFLLIVLGRQAGTLPLANPAQAINMMIFVAGLIFIPLVLRRNTTSLGAFFAPAAGFTLALCAPYLSQTPVLPQQAHFWYPLHTLSVTIGEALFIVAAIASLAYLIHERLIRQGVVYSPATELPPLSILDKILMHALNAGFITLTLGMLLGGFWAASAGIKLSSIAPKIGAGAASWLVFAFCIHQRYACGWQGRRTALNMLIGLGLSILLMAALQVFFPHSHGLGLLP